MLDYHRGFSFKHTTRIEDDAEFFECEASDGTRTATAFSSVSAEEAQANAIHMIDEVWFKH